MFQQLKISKIIYVIRIMYSIKNKLILKTYKTEQLYNQNENTLDCKNLGIQKFHYDKKSFWTIRKSTYRC